MNKHPALIFIWDILFSLWPLSKSKIPSSYLHAKGNSPQRTGFLCRGWPQSFPQMNSLGSKQMLNWGFLNQIVIYGQTSYQVNTHLGKEEKQNEKGLSPSKLLQSKSTRFHSSRYKKSWANAISKSHSSDLSVVKIVLGQQLLYHLDTPSNYFSYISQRVTLLTCNIKRLNPRTVSLSLSSENA